MLRKKILLPLLALAIVVTAMAFKQSGRTKVAPQTSNVNPSLFLDYYFHYTGPSNPSFYDCFNPNNYVMLALGEDEGDYCQPGVDALCVIKAPRIWNGTRYVPDLGDTSAGSARTQLHEYFFFGRIGSRIFTRADY